MLNPTNVGIDVSRTGGLLATGWALYASWLSTYGSAIVTTLSIVYGVYALYTRRMENKAIMKKNEEVPDVSTSN